MENPTPPPPPSSAPSRRVLRRSRDDRMLTGVAGGLGEYFGVDPVIFRVLFAVLSFFGGVGLIVYFVGWLLIPEPDVETSVLEKAVTQLRLRKVPPWVVIVAAALVLWLGWFSWWAPGPTFPALALITVLLIVLVSKTAGRRSPTAGAPATAGPGGQAGTPGDASVAPEPLVRPMGEFQRSVSEWASEARRARELRRQRRRPVLIAVGLALMVGLTVIGIIDGFHRLRFGIYPWYFFAVFGLGFLVSLLARRTVWAFFPPALVAAAAVIALGSTQASLTDGTGRHNNSISNEQELVDQRIFAGQLNLDLRRLQPLSAPRTVKITQAAGEVRLQIPASLDITVVARVHGGDIQVINPDGSVSTGGFGNPNSTQENGGWNTTVTVPPADASPKLGSPLTVRVNLTLGHIEIDRAG